MKKTVLAAAIAALTGFGPAVQADATEDRFAALEQRLSYLEQRVKAQDAVIEEKDRQIAELQGETGSGGGGWFQSIEFGGVVEVEAGVSDTDGGDAESSIAVPTVELGIAAEVNDWVGAEIVLLYEDEGESDGQLNVDTAVISIADPESNWFVNAGQVTLPFGVYETQMISDPLTLDLGETSDAAIEAGFASGNFSGSVYVFEGDQFGNHINNFGAQVTVEQELDGMGMAASLGYINDIAETDNIVDDVADNMLALTGETPAWVISAMLTSGPFTVIGEYLAATDSISAYAGDQPSAYNIEAGYAFEAGSMPANVAIGYQGTNDAQNLFGGEFAESRYIAALALEIFEGTSLAFEYSHDEDYAGGESDTLTGQIAVEF